MFSFKQSRQKDHDDNRMVSLPIDSVLPNPDQPRRTFDETSLCELSRSISQYGLMQPVLVRFTRRGYELIAGERRWRACRMAGMTHIDAIVTEADDATTACMALVENLQRENLHFFEEAESYVSLMKQFGLTQDELANRLGRNQSTVANKLGAEAAVLRQGGGAAIQADGAPRPALLRLTNEEDMLSAVATVREGLLSVKDTERLVERMVEKRLREFEEERQEAKKGRVVRLVRDYRLYVNTLKRACAELRAAGMDAVCRVVESETEYSVTVAIPKYGKMAE